MRLRKSPSFLTQIASDNLWGKRGFVKKAHLWLPLSLLVARNASEGRLTTAAACFQVFLVVVCWGRASVLLNDLTDREIDRAAGKERWISRLPQWAAAFILASVAGAGVLVLVLSGAPGRALQAYAGAVALGLLYSVRPVRFKERGLWGMFAYSLCGTLGFVVVPWTWLGADWQLLAVLAPAMFLDKWVNLHFHQVVDYETDCSSGTRTLAVLIGLERTRISLQWVAVFASISLVAVFAFLGFLEPIWRLAIFTVCGGTVLSAALYTRRSRQHLAKATSLVRELPWPYLGLTYAVFRILPLILFARLALAEPTMWLLTGVVGLSLLLESQHSARYRRD